VRITRELRLICASVLVRTWWEVAAVVVVVVLPRAPAPLLLLL
jgi:hypothetical protein